MKEYKPTILLVLDGWGIAPNGPANAIELAKKPNFDKLWNDFPHTELCASNSCVGLPNNHPGNSEAGHMNIGAGRVVFQDSVIINRAIADKSFTKNMSLRYALDHVKANDSHLHLMGLISDGDSPHVSTGHLLALVELAKNNKVKKVYLHLFTDGRDSPQRSATRIITDIMKKIDAISGKEMIVEISSIMGRFYAMDRGKNWDRTRDAYNCLIDGKTNIYKTYQEAIEHSYNEDCTDEYIEPAIIADSENKVAERRIKDNDSIIFFNLRSDRARQLTKAFVQDDFNKKNPGSFKRSSVVKNLVFVALTYFGPDLSENIVTAFPGADMIATLPFVMNSYNQLYISETEKFAHVTYFINGGYPESIYGEKRVMIPSPKVLNYKEKPAMAVYEITDYVLAELDKKEREFIVINFANPDMLGHTGDLKATVKAIEHVDVCLGKLSKKILELDGTMIVTADHGNAEKMIYPETGEICSEHTTNPVPFILVNKDTKIKFAEKGRLGDIAPTLYDYMNINLSDKVTGNSLIIKNEK